MNTEVNILLVEDNEGDIVLTIEAFKQAQLPNLIQVVKNGEEALSYLQKEGPYADTATPDLILLDINLPRLGGIEVLTAIKKDDVLRLIPVVMLTTSDSHKDIHTSYQNYASCYITKPVDFDKFMDVVLMIKEFWINIVRLPNVQKTERQN